jgi:hypothetical protein
MPVIGMLNSSSPDPAGDRIRAFRRGLSETGYVEGRNVTIEYRWADGQNERLPAMAADLVRQGVNVIVTGGTPATRAAKAATTTIPIVFILSTDPVEAGLVASLSRPGGNLTGVTALNVELAPKKLELLRELLLAAIVIALLVNPTNATAANNETRAVQAAARSLGLQLSVLDASTERDFDSQSVPKLTFQPYGDCSAAPDQGVSTPFPALKPFQFSFWTGQPEGLSGVSGQTVRVRTEIHKSRAKRQVSLPPPSGPLTRRARFWPLDSNRTNAESRARRTASLQATKGRRPPLGTTSIARARGDKRRRFLPE